MICLCVCLSVWQHVFDKKYEECTVIYLIFIYEYHQHVSPSSLTVSIIIQNSQKMTGWNPPTSWRCCCCCCVFIYKLIYSFVYFVKKIDGRKICTLKQQLFSRTFFSGQSFAFELSLNTRTVALDQNGLSWAGPLVPPPHPHHTHTHTHTHDNVYILCPTVRYSRFTFAHLQSTGAESGSLPPLALGCKHLHQPQLTPVC